MIILISTRDSHKFCLQDLKQYNNIEKIVLMNQEEFNYLSFSNNKANFDFESLIDFVNDNKIDLYIINNHRVGEPVLHDITNNRYERIKDIIPWETYFFIKTYVEIKKFNVQDFYLNSADEIKHTFVYLNNRPHPHRCILTDLLAKYDLIEKQAVSWNILSAEYNLHKKFNFRYWEETKLHLSDDYSKTTNHSILPTEYYSSFIQVINESTLTKYFLTEKTAVPLLTKKPFIIFNKKNYNNWLKELGFCLYDEIFDYSFDSIDDDLIRFEEGIKNLVRLNNMSREEQLSLYKTLLPKLEINKQRALEFVNNKEYWPATIVSSLETPDKYINYSNHLIYIKEISTFVNG